ncbi:hypothetical protein K1719_043040 [Acacia pycnantha]|nr:hypothetical protein K1719_043040 [Acacia pycnantha]
MWRGLMMKYSWMLVMSSLSHKEDSEPLCVISEEMNRNFPTFSFSERMKKHLHKAWKNVVIVKLLGKSIGYKLLLSILQQLWAKRGVIRLINIGNIFFVVKLTNKEDYLNALTGGPWMVFDHYLIVRPREPLFHPKQATIDKCGIYGHHADSCKVGGGDEKSESGLEAKGGEESSGKADTVAPMRNEGNIYVELGLSPFTFAFGQWIILTIGMCSGNSLPPFLLTAVYVLPENSQKLLFWEELRNLASSITNPWVVMGDFNDIASASERTGGSGPIGSRLHSFTSQMQQCHLSDLGAIGPKFTWRGPRLRDGRRLFERLDRAIVNQSFLSQFSDCIIQVCMG